MMNSQHDVFLTNRVSLLYLRVLVAFLLPQRLANVGIGMDTILHLHLLFMVSRSIHVSFYDHVSKKHSNASYFPRRFPNRKLPVTGRFGAIVGAPRTSYFIEFDS